MALETDGLCVKTPVLIASESWLTESWSWRVVYLCPLWTCCCRLQFETLAVIISISAGSRLQKLHEHDCSVWRY